MTCFSNDIAVEDEESEGVMMIGCVMMGGCVIMMIGLVVRGCHDDRVCYREYYDERI